MNSPNISGATFAALETLQQSDALITLVASWAGLLVIAFLAYLCALARVGIRGTLSPSRTNRRAHRVQAVGSRKAPGLSLRCLRVGLPPRIANDFSTAEICSREGCASCAAFLHSLELTFDVDPPHERARTPAKPLLNGTAAATGQGRRA